MTFQSGLRTLLLPTAQLYHEKIKHSKKIVPVEVSTKYSAANWQHRSCWKIAQTSTWIYGSCDHVFCSAVFLEITMTPIPLSILFIALFAWKWAYLKNYDSQADMCQVLILVKHKQHFRAFSFHTVWRQASSFELPSHQADEESQRRKLFCESERRPGRS